MENTNANDYKFGKAETNADEKGEHGKKWFAVDISERAFIGDFGERRLFKMPDGAFAGYAFYIPQGLAKKNEDGSWHIALPEDFDVKLTDKRNSKEETVKAENFVAYMKENGQNYEEIGKPKEGARPSLFAEAEKRLRESLPEEMKARANWCILRTRKNEETGKVDKFLIDCNTGKFAKSDDSSTWTDFESACKYARENGGVALAYALDGKDNICCIDLDHCKGTNGEYSDLAKDILKKCGDTYSETSVSGKGLHVFGKTSGMDVRAFSKDGDMEFYQSGHFIAMTGDGAGSSNLESMDTPEMKSLIESKCDKRKPVNGAGLGVEGLSTMTDRDVVEKAMASKNGDTFKALYEGKDLQNNHSNSDMSLMNRLAFWCNGDKEQMLRIFATSGLYRPEKSQGYYESTVIKAIRDNTERFQPQQSNKPKNNGNGSGSGNGK